MTFGTLTVGVISSVSSDDTILVSDDTVMTIKAVMCKIVGASGDDSVSNVY